MRTPNMWRHLGAGAAGMVTVLGIAALVSRKDPHRIENVSAGAAVVSSVAATHRAAPAAEPDASAVPAGETVTVDVENEGYRPRTVEVDGSSLEPRIKLGRLPVAPKPATSSAPRTTRIGGVVVVNPWAP